MKGVFLGLSIFLLSGALLLEPAFGYSIPLGTGSVIPLALMFLGILTQIDSVMNFRKLLAFKLKETSKPEQTEKNESKQTPPSLPNQDALILLGLLQQKARILDFAMEDISSYPDQEVGVVARVVHQGLKEVLDQHFEIKPIFSESEGSQITVKGSKDARFLGPNPQSYPAQGTLQHPGWQTKRIHLPKILSPLTDEPYIITPAEVTPL